MRRNGRLARLLAAALVMAMLLPLMGTAQAASYPYDTMCMDNVNLRSRANTTSTILKKIEAGDTVTILGKSGSFYRVAFDGATGYAMQKYVDGTDNSPDPSPDPSLTMQAPPAVYTYPYDTTVVDFVKLRKKAEADADVIQTLPADSVVTVLDVTSSGFARVRYSGKTGYVLASYVNLADIPVPTPEPSPTLSPEAAKYTSLKKGDSGDFVSALQSALTELGYFSDTVDGKFGAKTESALLTFQKRNGLTQDGIADEELQLLMYEGTPKDTRGYRQYVRTVPPVAGALIKLKSTGTQVSKLQTRLKELGYYAGDITGTCDQATVDALLAFEGKHGLVADGEADADDQNILYGATAMGASVVVTPAPTPAPTAPMVTLRRSDRSDEVKVVQQRLKEMGYYTGNITGTYNAGTEEAIKAFQQKSGLEVDGVYGPITGTALFGAYAIYAVPTAIPITETATEAPITEDNVILIRSGSMGEAVLRLQRRLQELNYYTSRLDGVYLTDDITAVRAFQSANGLKVDGKAGYQTQSLLYSDAAIAGNASATTGTTAVLRYGSEGAEVTTLQNRLIELGYLTGTADGKFGTATKTALMAFQRANNLTRDGIAGAMTMAALNATTATSNKVTATSSLRLGDMSEAVRTMQNRLITLGYLKGTADGKFGAQTSLALIAFQRANGLTADGIAGTQTITKLNSTSASTSGGTTSTTTTATAPTVSNGGISASQVRYANWYTEVKARCRLYPNATIYDFTTGISWQVNMFSLGAHADAEPLTAADTANMNRAFGGKTTWTPKAVWVVFSDGRVYMASTHNTPHDTWHIRTNDFDGHICIHFPRTQSQVEAIGPYATSHQKAIDLGWEATLRRAN